MARNKNDKQSDEEESEGTDVVDEQESSNESTALVPVHEQTVNFYGDPISVAQTPEGELYVPLGCMPNSWA